MNKGSCETRMIVGHLVYAKSDTIPEVLNRDIMKKTREADGFWRSVMQANQVLFLQNLKVINFITIKFTNIHN